MEFLSHLRQSVQCPLCKQTEKEPKLLKCFHTFCKSCIQRHVEPKEEANSFKCPECSSETLLQGMSDVENLRPSLLHQRILQVLAFSESDKSCSVSETHSQALCHCFDCDDSLCDECLEFHRRFTKDHRVVSLSDMKKEDLESSMMSSKILCKTHSCHNLELFCKECKVWVCLLCLKDDHNGHETQTLQEFTAIKKDLLFQNLDQIENLHDNQAEMQQQEEIARNMIKDGENAKKEVQKMTKKLVKYLLDQEQELLDEIQGSVARADRNLHLICSIAAAKEYMKSILANGVVNAVDIDEYLKTFKYDPFPSVTSMLAFRPDENLSLQVMKAKLGHLTLEPSPMFYKIEIESDLNAMRKAKLSVVTTETPTETLKCDDPGLIDIQISPKSNVKMEETTIQTGDKLQVEFVSRVSGQLRAEVKLDGIPLSNSPLVMDVKPQNIVRTDYNTKLKAALNTGSKHFTGIAVNKSNSRFAVADGYSHCVRVFKSNGDLLVQYGSEGSLQGQLQYPQGLAFLNDTDLVIVDYSNHRICIVNTVSGALIKMFGSYGHGNGEFSYPMGVHVDNNGNIIVSDSHNHRVQVFTTNGDYQYQFTVPNQNHVNPSNTITHNGLFYVSDRYNEMIYVVDMTDGTPSLLSTIREQGNGEFQKQEFCGLGTDNEHNLLVCNFSAMVITKFTLDGHVLAQTSECDFNPENIAVLDNGHFVCSGLRGVEFFHN